MFDVNGYRGGIKRDVDFIKDTIEEFMKQYVDARRNDILPISELF